jgi:hypothetical protein
MFSLVAIGWIHLVLVLVLPNIINGICLKLKSKFRIIHKFSTVMTYSHSVSEGQWPMCMAWVGTYPSFVLTWYSYLVRAQGNSKKKEKG